MTKAQQKTRQETRLNQAYDFFLEAEEAQRTFTTGATQSFANGMFRQGKVVK